MIWIMLISLLLEIVTTNFISMSGLFVPLFTVVSIVCVQLSINRKYNRHLFFVFIMGLAYDTLANTVFLNAVIFTLLALVTMLISRKFEYNLINSIIISILAICSYRLLTYFILILVNYINFDFYVLFRSIISSLIMNIAYCILVYYMILKITKKIINNKKNFLNK